MTSASLCRAASTPTTQILGAVQDARIADGYEASQIHGSEEEIIVAYLDNLRVIGLVEFDLGAIPSSATVRSAELRLYHLVNLALGQRYDAFPVTSPWSEDTVTYNSRPTFDSTSASTLIIPDNEFRRYRSWDVTAFVRKWVEEPASNFGLWVEEIPIQGSAVAWFSSSEAPTERHPQLVVEWVVPEPGSACLLVLAVTQALGWCRSLARDQRPGQAVAPALSI
jgi:hypothetical protein